MGASEGENPRTQTSCLAEAQAGERGGMRKAPPLPRRAGPGRAGHPRGGGGPVGGPWAAGRSARRREEAAGGVRRGRLVKACPAPRRCR